MPLSSPAANSQAPPFGGIRRNPAVRPRIPKSELDALVGFFNATNGSEWSSSIGENPKQGWLADSNPGNWHGVVVRNGHVREVNLPRVQNMEGDGLFHLGKLPYLERIYVTLAYSLAGDLSSLGELKRLKHLNLAFSNITGDLSDLEELRCLEVVRLNYNSVSGDISSLSGLTDLTEIRLHHTSVVGDIMSLSSLSKLQTLYAGNTSLGGDLAVLSNFPDLTGLRLNRTQVYGSIDSLSGLNGLLELVLSCNNSSSGIDGNLSSISYMSGLERIALKETSVTGDLSDLSNLSKMGSLSLSDTQVTGDVSNLSGASFGLLDLTNAPVYGDIGSLSALPNTWTIRLSGTGVHGDIGILASMPSLYTLELSDTSVDTYTSTTLDWPSAWSRFSLKFRNLGLSQQEVDDFLCDLAGFDDASGGTLDIGGNNSAPSEAGQVCLETLQTNDWTVTANI